MLKRTQYEALTGKKILVVEDVEMNQYLARHIIESWGCVVKIAGNGVQALAAVQQEDFDLVLMDIHMPVMDGIEATQQIRALEDGGKSAIPIVALTANATKENFIRYADVGMNDCLFKPFEENDLFAIVSKNVRKHKGQPMNSTSLIDLQVAENGAARTGGLYNLAMIRSISGGDDLFIERMLKLFLETVPPTLTAIRKATDQGEWLELSKLAHKLKSTIDTMGIEELKQDIRTIEVEGKTGMNTSVLAGLVEKVEGRMGEVMVQVRSDHGF